MVPGVNATPWVRTTVASKEPPVNPLFPPSFPGASPPYHFFYPLSWDIFREKSSVTNVTKLQGNKCQIALGGVDLLLGINQVLCFVFQFVHL